MLTAMRHRKRLLIAAIAVLTAAGTVTAYAGTGGDRAPEAAATAGAAAVPVINTTGWNAYAEAARIAIAPDGEIKSMPAVFAAAHAGGQRIIQSHSDHADAAKDDPATPVHDGRTTVMQYSDDGGKTFKPAVNAKGQNVSSTLDGAYMEARNIAQTGNTVVAIDTVPIKVAQGVTKGCPAGRNCILLRRHTSADGGKTWTRTADGVLPLSDLTAGSVGQFFQGITVLRDGSWVAPYYAKTTDVADFTVSLIKSTDAGATWTKAARVFSGSGSMWTEATVAQRADGKLIMIARRDTENSAGLTTSHMYSRISNDTAGTSWSAGKGLAIQGAVGTPSRGVAPRLTRIGNGVLMLTYGRPGNQLAMSFDGYGNTWSRQSTLYTNSPPAGGSAHGHPSEDLGSSGYIGVAVLDATTFLLMGDNCQGAWGCDTAKAYPVDRAYKLWTSVVHATLPKKTFESDAAGAVPAGFASTSQATAFGPSGTAAPSRVLRLNDDSATAPASVKWIGGAGTRANLSFKVRAYGTTCKSFLFTVVGRNSAGAQVTAQHFMLSSAGAVSTYVSGAWTPVRTADGTAIKVANANAWNTVTVDVTSRGATLKVNTTSSALLTKGTQVPVFAGYSLSSAGTSPVGDDWFVDEAQYFTVA